MIMVRIVPVGGHKTERYGMGEKNRFDEQRAKIGNTCLVCAIREVSQRNNRSRIFKKERIDKSKART